MSSLPEGWVWATVGDIATLVRGVSFKKHEVSAKEAPGLVPILRAGNVQNNRLDLDGDLVWVPSERVAPDQLLRRGDIVVATSSGSLSVVGKSALLADGWHGAHGAFMTVVRSSDAVVPGYLAYRFQSQVVRRAWSAAAAGTSINNLKTGDLTGSSIPLPPRAEQERIVAAIDEHLSRLDAAEAALHSAEVRIDQLLVASRAASFRQAWPSRPLRTVAATQLGKMLSAKSKTGIGSVPYLRNKNVRWGAVDVTDVAVMDFSDAEREKFALADGDVLVCEGGAGVGRTAIWRGELDVCCYQKALHRIRPGAELLSEFLAQFLRHLVETRRIEQHLSGVAIGHFPQEDLRSLEVPVPSLTDQRRIVEELSRQDTVAASAQSMIRLQRSRAVVLRWSVLSAAFSGQLVPQGHEDQSGIALLNRTGASRAAIPTRKPKASTS